MARARNIKPSLFKNEILGTADPNVTLLFISLWCLADREGRLEDRPSRIKAETFPYKSEVDIERSLNELQRNHFIIRYKVGDLQVIQVTNFCKHQSPHNTEKQSVLPPCDSNALIINDNGALTGNSSLSNAGLTAVKRPDSLIPDSLIPDTGYLITNTAKANKKNDDPDFDFFWSIYPKRPGANKTQAAKAWQARLKEGVSPEEILAGTDRYSEYCKSKDVEPQYIKQAATFIGPDKHFLSDWSGDSKAKKFDSWLNGGKGGDDDFIDV